MNVPSAGVKWTNSLAEVSPQANAAPSSVMFYGVKTLSSDV